MGDSRTLRKPGFFVRHPVLGAMCKAALLLLLVFATTEIALRVYLSREAQDPLIPTEFRPHPTMFWVLRPNLNTIRGAELGIVERERRFVVRTNSLGLRDDEIPARRPPGEYRVLCLGDSITYGHGVRREDSYESRLQEMLYAAYPKRGLRVINGGCPGYSTFQGEQLFRRLDPKVRPDLIILAYLYADPAMEENSDKNRAEISGWAGAVKKVLYQSETYLLLRKRITFYLEHRKMLSSPAGFFSLNQERVSLEDYRAALTRMVETVRQRGGQAILVNLPRSGPDPVPRYQKYRQTMAQVAKDTGALYLDLHKIFDSEPDPSLYFIHLPDGVIDEIHPNEAGYQLFARSLADLIIRSGILDRPTGQ